MTQGEITIVMAFVVMFCLFLSLPRIYLYETDEEEKKRKLKNRGIAISSCCILIAICEATGGR